MKKNVFAALKFVFLLAIILKAIAILLDFGIKKNVNSIFAKPNKICSNNNLPQIAIFSSSVGEMGFDCEEIEKKTHTSAYNFSLSGTRFLQYKGLIEELNSKSANTEIVILSESIFSFEKLKAVTDIQRFLPCINNQNIYNSLYNLQPELAFKCRYIPFYKFIVTTNAYYNQSFIGLKNFLLHKKFNDSLKGQTRIYRNWEADQDNIWKNAKPIPITIDSAIFESYKNTVNNLAKNNKKVFLMITPLYLPKNQKIVNLAPYRKKIASLANNKTVFFIDFSESMVDKKYFYNAHHLNAFGAKLFSNLVADSINHFKNKQ